MNPEHHELKIENNRKRFRFEVTFDDGKVAYLEYRWKKADMLLMSTFVPTEHRGQGIAGQLAEAAFQHAKNNSLKVQVYCPFIQKYIEKYPEYRGLLA